jgi:hypothetical protein
MGASVKAGWIERHKAEQREREEQERGRRVERALLIVYAVTQVAAAGGFIAPIGAGCGASGINLAGGSAAVIPAVELTFYLGHAALFGRG